MVLYFKSQNSNNVIYMGKDKFENEELIKHAWDIDVWFHVDNYSSAHVYLRNDREWDDISEPLLEELAQLTKANSIEGNKVSVKVIYTPATNLKKTNGMEVGQVSFHNPKLVRYVYVAKRDNKIVNALNKTKLEKQVDLEKEKIEYQKQKRNKERQIQQEKRNMDIKEQQDRQEQQKKDSYKDLFTQEAMDNVRNLDYDDFW